jgi:hypothetical protein
MALAFLGSAVVVWPDLIITNAAGVRAGITGIVHRQVDNSIGVDFAVIDPLAQMSPALRSNEALTW